MKLKTIVLATAVLCLAFSGCSSQNANNTDTPKEKHKEVLTGKISHANYFNAFLNDKQGITVGAYGTMYYTDDGGTAWNKGQNKSNCMYGCDLVDDKIAFATGNGNTRVTNDGGKSWSEIEFFGSPTPNQNRYISFINAQTGWIATVDKFGATQDGGKTWSEIKLPEGLSKIAGLSLFNESTGYLLDEKGLLFVTADSGKTWAQKAFDISGLNLKEGKISTSVTAHAAIRFLDEKHGLIAFSSLSDGKGKTWISETKDGGDTWNTEELDLGTDFLLTNVYITHDGKYLTVSNMSNVKVLELNY